MANPILKHIAFMVIALCLFSRVNSAVVGDNGASCCDDNVINVNGQGKVSVQPDIAIVNVGISRTSKTSQEATQRVA